MGKVTDTLAKQGIFYGWLIVAVAFLANFSKVGFTGFLFGVFLKPMSEDLGWTRAMATGAVTFGSLIAAASGFMAGRFLDRFGARLLVTIGAVLMGAAFIGLSQVYILWHFYLFYALGRMVAMSVLSDAQMIAAVSKWFVRRRGTATAITFMGAPLGGFALAMLSQRMIDNFGWREAWLALAVITWALLILPGALFMRRIPEDMGLKPDGDISPTEETDKGISSLSEKKEVSWPLRPAMRTQAFWLLSGVGIFGTISGSIVGFHQVPFYTDRGISTGAAAAALGAYSLFQGLGAPFWGFLVDRWHIRYVITATLALSAVAILLLMSTTSAAMALAVGAFLGFAQGGFWNLNNVVWAVYFGRDSLGAIRGISWTFQLLAVAIGPFSASLLFDMTGSYFIPFAAAFFAKIICMAFMVASRPPQPTKLTSAAPSFAKG